jgi:hypothetical protein
VQAAGERRLPRGGPPAPPLGGPGRDRLQVGPGLAAQACGLACERLIRLALAGALEDPCHLGERVGPPAGELAQPGRRGALLGGGEIAPLRMMARLAEQLGDEDTVSLRALIDHVF